MKQKKFRGWCMNRCGSTLKENAAKFCSVKCQQAFNFEVRSRLLESGDYFVLQPKRFIRNYLTRRFGEQCSRCGWAERHAITKRVPIEVEHIDGDWRNNRLENLTLLCPNCHALTPTFRGLNRGRGRAYRLGGRENPIRSRAGVDRTPPRPVRKQVFEPPSRQLQLLIDYDADVAQLARARNL